MTATSALSLRPRMNSPGLRLGGQSSNVSGQNRREKEEKQEPDGEDLEAPELGRVARVSASH